MMPPKLEGFAPLFQVFDMQRSLRFHRDTLGFEVIGSSEPRSADDLDWVLLRNGEIELMLNTAYEHDRRPAAPPPDRVAQHEDAALFFGCRDLDAAYDDLRASGIDLEPPSIAPYGMRQLWLKDPDGYVICLQWPSREGASDGDQDREPE